MRELQKNRESIYTGPNMIKYADIQDLLNGLWPEIMSMYGIDVGDFRGLNTKNGPCPLCGGHDRAHWREQQGRIALFCRSCAPDSMHSPERVIMDATHIDFAELVKNLADYINHVPQRDIKKAKIRHMAQPKNNMPISHRQDHALVERFLSGCEWCHSINLLGLNAPNPQKLPSKNNIDYWPMYNQDGIMINLAKYSGDQPQFIAKGMSYGALYKIAGGKKAILVISPIDGILCWYKTRATIYIAFTESNLRYCFHMRKDFRPIVCVRGEDLADEFSEDGEARILTGGAYGEFLINKVAKHENIQKRI